VLWRVAVCCGVSGVSWCVLVCCSALQSVAVRCSPLQSVAMIRHHVPLQVPMADAVKNQILVGLDSPDDCAVVAPDPQVYTHTHDQ